MNGTDVATIPCAASSTSPLASTAEDSHGSRHHAKRRTLRAGADPAGGTRAGAGLRKSRSAQRDPGPGAGAGRGRLAQCEPSATRSTPPRAARAQRDTIRLRWIRASPPRTMRPRGDITKSTPQRRGSGGRRPGSRSASSTPSKRRRAGGARHSHGAVGRLPQGRERADGRHPSHVEAELHSIHSTITFAVSAPLFQPCIGCIDQRRIDVRS